MEFNFRKSAVTVVALMGVVFANNVIFKKKTVEVVEVEEEVTVKKTSKRGPASSPRFNFNSNRPVESFNPQVTTSRAESGNFNQNADMPEEREPASEGTVMGSTSMSDSSSVAPSYAPTNRVSTGSSGTGSSSTAGKATTTTSTTSSSGSNGFGYAGGGGMISGIPVAKPAVSTGTSTGTTPSTGTSSNPVSDNLSCAASVGGGAFGNPIQVSLSCTTTSTIKYCIQENTCCDPETAGLTYSTPVAFGNQNGTYCLSFYGETTSNKVSSIVQNNYVFNNTYPDLQTSFPKIFYQTTQLAGLNYLQSTDFSKNNYQIGEINLKSHDPSPSGLNMDCQEIVEDYATLTPAPVQVFTPINMNTITLGDQLNIPLALTRLVYGDNFITSYVVNNNFAAPLYACSTNKVVLNDFEFFAPETSHGEVGTNSVREFAGSFVSYSFFESDADLNRLPAGSANENEAGQELRVGSFGVFY